ncbi:MAG: ABC transporter ATP-binding protein [Coriobacteriia bacterium]|nr:ABC transporter ATP-binding protein [Coriobacteriia bacterium]
MPEESVIRFEGVTKRFGRTVAVDDLTFDVRPGEVFGLLGPNGAGKTTTLRVLLGLLKPDEGRATAFGHDAWHEPVAMHRRMAYVPGELSVWHGLSGRRMLDLLGALHGGYDLAYREELVERFDFDEGKKGRSYSKGNRQKIAVIAGLMTRAELLVLDEPSGGLDPLLNAEFQECLREAKGRGQTVLLSSHILSEVEAVCDRVGILRRGHLAELGTLPELRHLSALKVEATIVGEPPPLEGVPGVEEVEVADGRVSMRVRGSTDPALKALSSAEVTWLQVREPSLEELFRTYYGEAGHADEERGREEARRRRGEKTAGRRRKDGQR